MILPYNIGDHVSVCDALTSDLIAAGIVVAVKDELPWFGDQKLSKIKTLLISFDTKYFFNVNSPKFLIKTSCQGISKAFDANLLQKYVYAQYNAKHVNLSDVYIENTIDELDQEVRQLVRVLNLLPNVRTSGSCSGHGIEPLWVSMTFRDVYAIKIIASILYDRFRNEFVLSTLNSRLQNTKDGVELALISLQTGEKAYKNAERLCNYLDVYIDTVLAS